jgi:ubiquitin-protein ligase
MSILYDEWSAVMNVGSIVRTLVSMLASAKAKAKPANDSEFVVRAKGKTPKDFYWTYDDDKC